MHGLVITSATRNGHRQWWVRATDMKKDLATAPHLYPNGSIACGTYSFKDVRDLVLAVDKSLIAYQSAIEDPEVCVDQDPSPEAWAAYQQVLRIERLQRDLATKYGVTTPRPNRVYAVVLMGTGNSWMIVRKITGGVTQFLQGIFDSPRWASTAVTHTLSTVMINFAAMAKYNDAFADQEVR